METHYGLGIHAFGSPVDRGKVSWEWIFGSLALLSREGNSQTGDRMFALDIFVSLHINVWMYLSDTSRPPPTTRNNRSTVDDECWVVGGWPLHNLSFSWPSFWWLVQILVFSVSFQYLDITLLFSSYVYLIFCWISFLHSNFLSLRTSEIHLFFHRDFFVFKVSSFTKFNQKMISR